MNRVDIGDFRGADDGGDVEIALGRRCGADADRLVRESHVKRVPVRLGVHRDGLDSHLLAGPDYPAGYLTPVRNQDLFDLALSLLHNKNPAFVVMGAWLQPDSVRRGMITS